MKAELQTTKSMTKPWRPMAAVACRHRHAAVSKGRSRTVTDDSGSLAIRAWTCAECGQLVEEIHILSRDGTAERPTIRYAVASPDRLAPRQTVSGRH